MREVNDCLPSGWIKTTLSEVTSASKAKAEPSTFTDAPYIGLEHIEGGNNRLHSVGTATDVKSTKNVFQRGDVLYGKLRPYLKKVCRPDFDGVCSTDILVFSKSSDFDNGYLLYFLSQQSTADYATQNSNGINLPRINSRSLGEIELPLAPFAEQRRIVAKIEALQERSRRAREALAEVRPLLEQLRKSVLADAFRGDLTADWRAAHPNVEPASELLHRIRSERRHHWERAELAKYKAKGQRPSKNWQDKYEEPEPVDETDLAKLPEGWVWASVAEITANHDNIRIPLKLADRAQRQGSYPYYGAFGIIDYIDDYLFDGEYVLIAEDGKNLLQRTRPISLIASGQFWVNNHAHVLTTFCQMPLGYIECFFNSPVLSLDQYLTGIDQVKLTQGALNIIPIPVAPLSEQQEIVRLCKETIEMVDRQLKAVAIMHDEADHLDQAILAKAFRGELVPQDPSDEPASVLLERIGVQRTQHAESAKQKSKAPPRSKTGKEWSRVEPQQLTLAEVLTAKGKLVVSEQRMTEVSYDNAAIDSQLPSQ